MRASILFLTFALSAATSIPSTAASLVAADSLSLARSWIATADSMRAVGVVRDGVAIDLAERALRVRESAAAVSAAADSAAASESIAECLSVLGRLRQYLAQTELARPLLERALQLRLAADPDTSLLAAQSLAELGSLESQDRNLAAALAVHRAALSIRERRLPPEAPPVAASLTSLGMAESNAGNLAAADSLLLRALAIREKVTPRSLELAMTLHGLGTLRIAQSRYEDALALHARAVEIREAILGPDHLDLAVSLNGLALANKKLERYAEAIPLYERAIAVAERAVGVEHPFTAMFMNNLAGIRWMLGSFEESLELTQRALAIRERTLPPDHPDIVLSLQGLAILYEATGKPVEAEAMFRRALATLEKRYPPEHPEVIGLVNRLGVFLADAKKYEEARPLLERALRSAESRLGPDHAETGQAWQNLGALEMGSGNLEAAKNNFERALTIRAAKLGPEAPLVGYALIELGELELLRGSPDAALGRFLAAEEIGRRSVERAMRTLSEKEAVAYDVRRNGGLEFALEALAEQPAPSPDAVAAVWDSLVRSRSVVVDLRAAMHRDASRGDDPASEAATRGYIETQTALARLLVAGAGGEATAVERAAIAAARRDVEGAERALAEATAADLELVRSAQAGFEEVRATLKDGEALVAYARTNETTQRLLAFTLAGPQGAPNVVTLGDVAAVDDAVAKWRDAVVHGGDEREAGARLRRLVWDPVASRLGAWESSRVVDFVPAGALPLVNFAALPTDDGRYLVEVGPAFHLASTERDLLEGEQAGSGTGFLAFGDPDFDRAPTAESPEIELALAAGEPAAPSFRGETSHCPEFASIKWQRLPGSAREANETAKAWSSRNDAISESQPTLVLTGRSASETSFKRLAPGRRVVHVATHGFFLGEECDPTPGTRGIGGLAGSKPAPKAEAPPTPGTSPYSTSGAPQLALSGLVLAGANRRADSAPDEDDGILTAEEIAALDLRDVDWVVLSACDTGVGAARASEGIFGLRRAFRIAGARTLVTSLWPVEDEAARSWMRELYTARFADGKSTAESVRLASLALLNERRARGASTSPFFWGGFVASGDPR